MWESFMAAVKKCLSAKWVYDKCRVVKYLNKGIDETRKQEVKIAPL